MKRQDHDRRSLLDLVAFSRGARPALFGGCALVSKSAPQATRLNQDARKNVWRSSRFILHLIIGRYVDLACIVDAVPPNEHYYALNHRIVLGDVVGLGGVELHELLLLQLLGRPGIDVVGVT